MAIYFLIKKKESQDKQIQYASAGYKASLNTATTIDAHSKSNQNNKTNTTARYVAPSRYQPIQF